MPVRETLAFEIDMKGFRDARGRFIKAQADILKKAVKPAADEIRDLLRDACKAEAPVGKGPSSGNLRDSIYGETSLSTNKVEIKVAIPKRVYYQGWVIRGRGWVLPVKKKALWWPGLPHPVAYARPSKPNPFMDRAWKKNYGKLYYRWQKVKALVVEMIRKY